MNKSLVWLGVLIVMITLIYIFITPSKTPQSPRTFKFPKIDSPLSQPPIMPDLEGKGA